ncbi:MAG TPA: hypothetical protein PKI60_07285 [Oscillospiraceae bacterium]|nr:hypothetical protein [Oscillospiraceae bacterium]
MIKLIKKLINKFVSWIRYKRIIKALNLEDRKELRDYALLKTKDLLPDRGNGKTISVIVKTLVHRKERLELHRFGDLSVSDVARRYGRRIGFISPMSEDPDYLCHGIKIQKWSNELLYKCWRRCRDKGIHVFEFIV